MMIIPDSMHILRYLLLSYNIQSAAVNLPMTLNQSGCAHVRELNHQQLLTL